MKRMTIVLFLMGAIATVAAQPLSPIRPSLFNRTVASVETQAQVDERLRGLEKDIPDGLSDLIAENNRVESDLNNASSASVSLSNEVDNLAKTVPDSQNVVRFKTVVANARTINCADTAAFSRIRDSFVSLHDQVDDAVPNLSPFHIDNHTSCDRYKSELGEVPSDAIDTWVHGKRFTPQEIDARRKLADSYGKLVIGLRARQTAIGNALKQIQQRESLTSNFPWFIALFGGLSLAAIFVVSHFCTPELQMEWVASGQITQFVTVMILMIVITMLGLSKTINGETLGTLLGGVAGYVLAQGVGRAAAHDASRKQS